LPFADHDLRVLPTRACERRQNQIGGYLDGKPMIGADRVRWPDGGRRA
jgi:hypothetical protein